MVLGVAVVLTLAGCAGVPAEGSAGGAGRASGASTASPGADGTGGTAAGDPATPDPSAAAARGAVGANQDPSVAQAPSERQSGVAPVRVQIAAIGVDSGLESLTRDSTGWIQPPVNFDSAGWYRDGVVPGDVGPAVIAGHIDSVAAPAVFARLAELTAGDQVQVTLSDQTVVTFTVDRLVQAAKAQFPTDEVYGPTPTAQLRLITCGGVFDDSTGHYVDNVIVFATRT
ncbi:class F sortase [Subtercola sp. YIM 133946]|uniref:class F sortase n=1 Tax=Subtercola sp. YIM 133946 TaxID=3118909 RepID=UPI002F92B4D6